MTAAQKLAAAVEALTEEAAAVGSLPEADNQRQRAAVRALHDRVLELEPEVQKLAKKAAINDPQKKIYGPHAIQTISKAKEKFEAAKAQIEELHAAVVAENHEAKQRSTKTPLLEPHGEALQTVDPEGALIASPDGPPNIPGASNDIPSSSSELPSQSRANSRDDIETPKHAESRPQARELQTGEEHSEAKPEAKKTPAKTGKSQEQEAGPSAASAPEIQTSEAESDAREPAKSAAPAKSVAPASNTDDAEAQKKLMEICQEWQLQATARPSRAGGAQIPEGSPFNLTGGGPELLPILQKAEETNRTVVLDFSAAWCGPCRAMKPVISQLAAQFQDRVAFIMIDCEATEANVQLSGEAQIRALPTFHIYTGTYRRGSFQGGKSLRDLKDILNQHLAMHPPKLPPDPAALREITSGLKILQQNTSAAEFGEACELLSKMLTNISQHPQETKFQRLKASNKRLRETLLARPGGVKCMTAAGFHVIVEAGSQVFVWREAAASNLLLMLRFLAVLTANPEALRQFEVPENSAPNAHEAASVVSAAGPLGQPSAAAGGSPNPQQRQQDAVVLLAAHLAQMLSQGPQPPGQ